MESLPDEESEGPAFRVHEWLTVKYESEKHISLHWRPYSISDMVSDSILALVLNISREIPKVLVQKRPQKLKKKTIRKQKRLSMHFLFLCLERMGNW